MLGLPLLETVPFQFGNLFDEALHLLVVAHGLAHSILPRFGHANLAQFAGTTLHQIHRPMGLAAGAMTVGFAALARAIRERTAEKPLAGGELGNAGAETALRSGEFGADERLGHVLYYTLYKIKAESKNKNTMRICSSSSPSLKQQWNQTFRPAKELGLRNRCRYYVCYNAQQQGWKNCETKSVPAQAIESAVLDSIRRIGTDPKLAEAVATEALNQVACRRRELDLESEAQRRSLRQLNQSLAREAAGTSVDSGARFERMATLQREIEITERRSVDLTAQRSDLDQDHINADDLRRTLAEFDAIWSSLSTKEQEQMIHLLVAKVGYDGRTGKVTVNFSNAGAKELCQGK